MSPSVESFNEAKYKTLMDGRECSEIYYSDAVAASRFDSEYYKKDDLDKESLINTLPYENIGDFAFVTDGIHTSIDFDIESKINLISAKAPKSNYFDLSGTGYISLSQNQKNPRTQLKLDDIIVSTVGTIGNCAVINKTILPANADRHVGIVRINDESKFKPRYVSTFILSKFGQFQVKRFTTGNVQPNLFIYKLKDIKVPFVSCSWQNTIDRLVLKAENLLMLSDSIMNETESDLLNFLGVDNFIEPNYPKRSFTIKTLSSSLSLSGRLDAEYYQSKYDDYTRAILSYANGYTYIREKFSSVKTKCDRIAKAYSYIEIGDVSVVDGSVSANLIATENLPDNAKIMTKSGDVLVSTVRPNRGAVAILESDNYLVSGAFTVLRESSDYPKEILRVLLRSDLYKDWLLRYNVGTSYPVIKDDDILNMPIPIMPKQIQTVIVEKVRESINLRNRAKEDLNNAKHAVEIAIEEGEDIALEWLKEKVELLEE